MKNKKTILLIDDEPTIGEIISFELTRHNLIVLIAKTAQSGLEKAENLKPDLIITDLNLHGFSGLDVLSTIKNRAPDLPIIIMTGHPSFSEREAFSLGAADLIRKPFSRIRLAESVKNLVSAQNEQFSRKPKEAEIETLDWNDPIFSPQNDSALKFGRGGLFVPLSHELPAQDSMIHLAILTGNAAKITITGRVRFVQDKPVCGFGLEVYNIEGPSIDHFKLNFQKAGFQFYIPTA